MKTTRTIKIRDRVFSLDDLKRIAAIFKSQQDLARRSDHQVHSSFQIRFSNDTSVDSESSEILDDNVLNVSGRPVGIRFQFHNYSLDRDIKFEITHGDSTFGNVASVSASDSRWLNDAFTSVTQAIQAAKPQTVWIRRHPTIFLHLIALSLGIVILSTIRVIILAFTMGVDLSSIVSPTPDDSPWKSILVSLRPLLFILSWVFCWFVGFPWALDVRPWFLKMWPNIELDMGAEHLREERTQRRRVKLIMTLIVLPIVIAVCYDAGKYVLSAACQPAANETPETNPKENAPP